MWINAEKNARELSEYLKMKYKILFPVKLSGISFPAELPIKI